MASRPWLLTPRTALALACLRLALAFFDCCPSLLSLRTRPEQQPLELDQALDRRLQPRLRPQPCLALPLQLRSQLSYLGLAADASLADHDHGPNL